MENDNNFVEVEEVASKAPGEKGERTIDANTPFRAIVDLFELCTKAAKPQRKRDLLQLVFSRYRRKAGENDIFTLMRLLLPHLDKERQSYGLKESSLAKYYVNALGIAATSDDATRMINWRKPAVARDAVEYEGGDFGQAVFLSLQNRCGAGGRITIANLNECLDSLNAHSEKDDRLKILADLLKATSAMEQRWIVRIILKELKIGVSEKTILGAFHPEAVNLYGVSNNLRQVCEKLKDPHVSLSTDNLSLFNPIKPMLANRHAPEKIPEMMEHSKFVIERKFDGERIQAHRVGNTIRYFSRNANEVTQQYGPHLTEHLLKALRTDKCILDGELMLWDAIANKFEEFGSLRYFHRNDVQGGADGGGRQDIGERYDIVFDILMVNEHSIVHLPLAERQVVLKRAIPQAIEKRVELCDSKPASTVKEIMDALEEAIESGDEGIMIKRLDSQYRPDERKNNWIKLKPEYVDGVGDELDLVVLGGFYGAGARRGGNVSHFLLGVRKDHNLYWTCARVGSGYSDNDLKELHQLLGKHWRPYREREAPPFFEFANNSKNRPDVYIEPQNSVVLQVKAAQIVPSDVYKVGLTLRFPRVTKIRNDKKPDSATSVEEFIEIAKLFQGRLNRQGRTANVEERQQKARKASSKITPTVATRFAPANDLSSIKVENKLLGGLEFCVLNGDKTSSKADLERMVHRNEGRTTQNPTKTTFACIAGQETLKVQNLKEKGTWDIIKSKWLVDCDKAKKLIPYEPRYMWHSRPATLKIFKNDIDEYGDSFTSETTPEQLQELFESMDGIVQENRRKALVRLRGTVPQPSASLNLSQLDTPRGDGPYLSSRKRTRQSMDDDVNSSLSQTNLSRTTVTPSLDLDNLQDDEKLDLDAIPFKRRRLILRAPQTDEDASMDIDDEDNATTEIEDKSIQLFEKHYVGENLLFGLFRGCRIYLDRFDPVNSPNVVPACSLDAIAKLVEFYGGRVQDRVDDKTTHIIIDPPDDRRIHDLVIEAFMVNKRSAKKKPFIIPRDWVVESIESRQYLDESAYPFDTDKVYGYESDDEDGESFEFEDGDDFLTPYHQSDSVATESQMF